MEERLNRYIVLFRKNLYLTAFFFVFVILALCVYFFCESGILPSGSMAEIAYILAAMFISMCLTERHWQYLGLFIYERVRTRVPTEARKGAADCKEDRLLRLYRNRMGGKGF